MHRRFFASILLLSMAFACGSKKKGPGATDPYPNVAAFCGGWATAACSDGVVSACSAPDSEACVSSQKSFCLQLVPATNYVSTNAQACIDAVGAAYADAILTAEELATVRELGEPCDKLVRGGDVGQNCSKNTDCDMISGLLCVSQVVDPDAGTTSATCQVPETVGGGEVCNDSAAKVCSDGFYCDEVCRKCIAPTDGPECTPKGAVGTTCSSNAECASGICSDAGRCANDIRLSAGISICNDLS